MFRNIATFYLLAMGLTLLTTIYLGAQGAQFGQVLPLAMLAWPTAALIMVARNRYARIRRQDFRR